MRSKRVLRETRSITLFQLLGQALLLQQARHVSAQSKSKKRVRSAILKFAITFLNDTWGLFKKQTSISNLTGNAQSWLQRLMSFGKKTTTLLSESHRTQHTEWSHCSGYIYCKCVWRLPRQTKCTHSLPILACLLTLFTPIENQVKCVFCFCICLVTQLLNSNRIEKHPSSLATDAGNNVVSLDYVSAINKLEHADKYTSQHS